MLEASQLDITITHSPSAIIEDCVFDSNKAEIDGTFTTTQVLEDMLFPGRGGGLSILINSITMVTVNVNNCKFVKNQATSFGGGAHSFGRIVQSHNYIPVM